MRLKRATSLKAYRCRRRTEQLGDELGARPRRRGRRRPDRQRPRQRPQDRAQRRQRREERVRQRLWSEHVPLGENIRIQAADGYRGAFLELRPGLYLVAELRDERGEFGRKVQVKDVTDEIVRVTDQALDAIFPRRRSQKRADRDEARRRADLARREQEQARRERQRAERERAEREAAARAAQSRALPAPQQRALPAPQSSSLPRGSARWLDADFEDYDEELAGRAEERWR